MLLSVAYDVGPHCFPITLLRGPHTKMGSSIMLNACHYIEQSGPSCSKLTTSLVNDSLKFTSSDTQIC